MGLGGKDWVISENAHSSLISAGHSLVLVVFSVTLAKLDHFGRVAVRLYGCESTFYDNFFRITYYKNLK